MLQNTRRHGTHRIYSIHPRVQDRKPLLRKGHGFYPGLRLGLEDNVEMRHAPRVRLLFERALLSCFWNLIPSEKCEYLWCHASRVLCVRVLFGIRALL